MNSRDFFDMTFTEYQYKIQGFQKHKKEMTWLNSKMTAEAIWASKDNPYPSLEEFLNPKKSPSEATGEEIFALAKEKGIKVPEGK